MSIISIRMRNTPITRLMAIIKKHKNPNPKAPK
jgi:hypothetical protein